jgi:acetolactate synthase-1/2/3 large subunit
MGYDLPASVGAAVARNGKRVICLAGDGSIQQNIQELQTISTLKLPVKVIVLNNDGYLSMRQTQSNFFGKLMGVGVGSGLSFPNYKKVGEAFDLESETITGVDMMSRLWELLQSDGPALCDVMLDPKQEFEPRLKPRQLPNGTIVSPALEDMYPFLDPEELRSNLFVKPLQ